MCLPRSLVHTACGTRRPCMRGETQMLALPDNEHDTLVALEVWRGHIGMRVQQEQLVHQKAIRQTRNPWGRVYKVGPSLGKVHGSAQGRPSLHVPSYDGCCVWVQQPPLLTTIL
jgi:hypothetical protein